MIFKPDLDIHGADGDEHINVQYRDFNDYWKCFRCDRIVEFRLCIKSEPIGAKDFIMCDCCTACLQCGCIEGRKEVNEDRQQTEHDKILDRIYEENPFYDEDGGEEF